MKNWRGYVIIASVNVPSRIQQRSPSFNWQRVHLGNLSVAETIQQQPVEEIPVRKLEVLEEVSVGGE